MIEEVRSALGVRDATKDFGSRGVTRLQVYTVDRVAQAKYALGRKDL